MNRGELLRRGMEITGTSQSELSRIVGVPQSRISRYVTGKLEPSPEVFDRLMSGLGVEVTVTVEPVEMERTKQRSWLLHREVSRKLSEGVDDQVWSRLRDNLVWVRSHTHGRSHERNLDRWQHILDEHDVHELRRVLVDTSRDGIGMREVSPVSGLLTDEERTRVLSKVTR